MLIVMMVVMNKIVEYQSHHLAWSHSSNASEESFKFYFIYILLGL